MKAWLMGASLLFASASAFGETITFDADTVGQPPMGWTCGATGKGAARWTVVADASAPSAPNGLKQDGTATFPWCVVNNTAATDGMVEVQFKPLVGKEDQAGGLVWRWKDGNNYYVARANALEQNVSLYYTIAGVRKTIASKNAPVAPKTWHTLRVIYHDNAIQVALDGKVYIDARDRHIPGAGKVGVWTKADSVTLFDDFTFAATPPSSAPRLESDVCGCYHFATMPSIGA